MKSAQHIVFGPFRFDPDNACLWRGAQALSLTPKAFALLLYLLRHPGRLVTKAELLTAGWPDTIVGEGVLKVCIGELRKVLGDQMKQPQFIETVHRRGYRFIASLTSPSQPHPSLESRVQGLASENHNIPSSAVRTLDARRQTPDALLVGREAELAQLHRWLDKALGGERHIVFVTGEPGIGKTRLVEAFVEQAGVVQELRVGWGQCVEHYGEGEAYLPVLEAVGQVCRTPGSEELLSIFAQYAPTWLLQLPALLSLEQRQRLQQEVMGATRERMLREMAEAVEALTQQRGLVLVLEDLQWSDYSTLDLISALARRREPARLFVIATYRPVDVIVSGHPLKTVRRELDLHGQCVDLSLESFTASAVATYLAGRFPAHGFPVELATVLHQRTDGNPLFLVTVVDYLVGQGVLREENGQWHVKGSIEDVVIDVPESLRLLVEKQVERLGGEEQRVLEAASVVGTEFSTAAVAAALEIGLSRVEELSEGLVRRSQFLYAAGICEWPDGTVAGRYGFAHALYQDVLYQRMAAVRRMRLHQRIGEREARGFGNRAGEVAAELAMHFEHGRDYERAVQYLRHAADNDMRRYANREAIGYLTRALALVEQLPDQGARVRLRMTLLQQLGLVHRAMGDTAEAVKNFAALEASAREYQQGVWEVQALLYAASTVSWVDHERCLETAERAVALSRRLADEGIRIHARAYYGYWHSLLRGWRSEDAQVCAEAVELARRAGDRTLLGLHLGRYFYFLCLQSTYQTVCRTAEQELQVALQVGDAQAYLTCQFFRAWALLHLGQWGEMLNVLKDGELMASTNQHLVWTMAFQLERAWLYEQTTSLTQGCELAEQAHAQALRTGHQYGQLLSLALLGWAHLGLGESQRAFHYFSEMTHQPGRVLMDLLVRLLRHQGLSEYWLAEGEYDKARREAQQLCELAAQPGEHTYLALGRRILAEIALAERQWGEAEVEISRALAVLEGVEAPLAAWRVYATAARLHQQQGHKAEAGHCWNRSATVLNRLADSLSDSAELRQSLLAHPSVRAVLYQAKNS